jgi:hypothetical protein
LQIDRVATTLLKVFRQTERHVVCLLGAPGLGKTSVVAQAAEQAQLGLLTLALPTCDAVDLRGLPQAKDGKTTWASPLPTTGRGVLLLDELTSAPRDVQVAAHHIVWSERGSDMTLAPGWHIVLTGNRAQDRSVYQAIGALLRNRMVLLEVESSQSAWCAWGQDHGVNPLVLGFLRWRPELLTAREIPAEGAFPSPRSWESCSRMLSLSLDAESEREMIAGTVGEGAGVEFCAYLRTARELPQVEEILHNPEAAPVSTSPSLCYAIVSMLAQYTRQNAVSAMRYISRLPAEYGVLYLTTVRDRYDLRKDPEIYNWIGKHKKLFQVDTV